jgi:hypothetical protein
MISCGRKAQIAGRTLSSYLGFVTGPEMMRYGPYHIVVMNHRTVVENCTENGDRIWTLLRGSEIGGN